MRRVLALMLLLPACKMTPDRYNAKVSDAFCKFQKRCAEADFWATYPDGVGQCVEARDRNLEALDAYYDNCLFDAKKAKACLDALDSTCKQAGAEYDERFQPCYEVWDCAQDYKASTDTALPF